MARRMPVREVDFVDEERWTIVIPLTWGERSTDKPLEALPEEESEGTSESQARARSTSTGSRRLVAPSAARVEPCEESRGRRGSRPVHCRSAQKEGSRAQLPAARHPDVLDQPPAEPEAAGLPVDDEATGEGVAPPARAGERSESHERLRGNWMRRARSASFRRS